MTTDLDQRYGRSAGSMKRTRFIGIIVAVAFTIVVVAWVVWGGLLSPNGKVHVDDTGHTVVSDTVTDVAFELTVDPDTSTRCALQALNDGFSIVGWKIIDIEPSDTRVRSFTIPVATTERAVTGLIYRCWLA